MTKLTTTIASVSIIDQVKHSLATGELGDVRSYLDEYFPMGNFCKQELVSELCTWNFDNSDGWSYNEFDDEIRN